jgi:tetratricopeptide (TPR) repeat protein
MPRRLLSLLVSIILFSSCVLAARSAWRTGVARLLVKYAREGVLSEPAQMAVELNPADPETHSALGIVRYNLKDMDGALEEFERAAALRPRDYFLWLQLGRARDEAGDAEGAAIALQKSIALAPYYSEPRWQYGNVLYRRGRLDDAFAEMRRASESNPSLFPAFIDLAWGTYKGDARATASVVRPQTDAQRLSLANFLAAKGEGNEALELFRASGEISKDARKSFLVELMKTKQFGAAYDLWAGVGEAGQSGASNGLGAITEPSFEGHLNPSEVGFGWQQESAVNGIRLSVDTQGAKSGSRSLLIEWSGHANPDATVISQLILVEPGMRYRLSFAARTEEVLTGGLPLLIVADSSAADGRTLAQSKPLPQGTTGWQIYETEFTATAKTEAVIIRVQRQHCGMSTCPMYGRIWLDDFSLQKLDARAPHHTS